MEKNKLKEESIVISIRMYYDPTHSCNKFLLRQEYKERNEALNNDSLYPTLNDPNFSLKIAINTEFNDTQYDGEIYRCRREEQIFCQILSLSLVLIKTL